MSWNQLSWKGLTCAAVAAVAGPALAQPSVVAPNPTLSGANYTWSIGVDPDDTLYGPNPGGGDAGGSVAIEWTLTSTGLSAAVKNGTNFPNDNPGNSGVDGLSAVAAGSVTANLGSTFLTGAGTFNAVTLTVPGPSIAGPAVLGNNHVSTVNVSGVYSAVGPPLALGGTQALISQDGANFLMPAGQNFQYRVFGGDANLSGGTTPVTITDLNILAANINKPGVFNWSQGDFNGSGTVTISDLNLLAANINRPVGAAVGGAIGGAGVPEPGSLMLVGLASIGLFAAARRNVKKA